MNYFERAADSGEQAGEYIAEIFIDWGICIGSCVFRQCAKTQEAANNMITSKKQWLREHLGRTIGTEMWVGLGEYKMVSTDMGYGFAHRIRTVTDAERIGGVNCFVAKELPNSR